MSSEAIKVRLNAEEIAMLDLIRISESRGEYNRSEMLRLLIHREHSRRTTGKSVVAGSDVQSENRVGRPKKSGRAVDKIVDKSCDRPA